jgi:hypothetical protein
MLEVRPGRWRATGWAGRREGRAVAIARGEAIVVTREMGRCREQLRCARQETSPSHPP